MQPLWSILACWYTQQKHNSDSKPAFKGGKFFLVVPWGYKAHHTINHLRGCLLSLSLSRVLLCEEFLLTFFLFSPTSLQIPLSHPPLCSVILSSPAFSHLHSHSYPSRLEEGRVRKRKRCGCRFMLTYFPHLHTKHYYSEILVIILLTWIELD